MPPQAGKMSIHGPHEYPASTAAPARCQHPTKTSRNNTRESNVKTCLVPLTVNTVICNDVNRECAFYKSSHSTSTCVKSAPYFNDIWPKSCSVSHRRNDGLATRAHALRRRVCPCFWLGQFGKVTSGKHVLAVSIEWHLKDLRGVSA